MEFVKYKKLTVLFKNNPNSEDVLEGGTHKVEYNDAFIRITENHVIIEEYVDNTITGQVFDLNTLHSYKIEY